MKVIFLDNDGVICLSNNFGSRFKRQTRGIAETVADNDLPIEERFDDFDKKAIKILNEILEKTGAEIVVSSDWRKWATLEELGDWYVLQGINKRPISFIPNLKDIDPQTEELFHYKHWFERTRILEVRDWLKNNEVDKWVAVDDMFIGEYKFEDGSSNYGLEYFVQTPRQNEGIKQCGVKEKIIKFLNN